MASFVAATRQSVRRMRVMTRDIGLEKPIFATGGANTFLDLCGLCGLCGFCGEFQNLDFTTENTELTETL